MNRKTAFILAALIGSLLLSSLALMLHPTSAAVSATSHFVAPGGSGAACTQVEPCTLQTALSAASEGDTLYLTAGTYRGSGGAVITTTHSLTLLGGWDGGSSTPPVVDPLTYPSRIDGESQRRGVFVESGTSVTLEGLTIMSGTHTYKGAGLYARDAQLTLRGMDVISNVIDIFAIPGTYAYGAGAMVEGGTLIVESSTFHGNSAWARTAAYGGGLAISRTLAVTVTASVFENNDAWQGGALYFRDDASTLSPLTLIDNVFTGNGQGRSVGNASSGYAGAVYIYAATAHLETNTITDNRAANDYGALHISGSAGNLTRSTITGNRCARISGLNLSYSTPFTVTNTIVAGNISTYDWLPDTPAVAVAGRPVNFRHNTIAHNASDYGIAVRESATVALTNTILLSHTVGVSVTAGSTAALQGTLWGSGIWANDSDWGGAGAITAVTNLWGDPAFVNPTAADYHIQPGSAARDAGLVTTLTTDIDGDPRPIGPGFDIGADEVPLHLYLPLVLRNTP